MEQSIITKHKINSIQFSLATDKQNDILNQKDSIYSELSDTFSQNIPVNPVPNIPNLKELYIYLSDDKLMELRLSNLSNECIINVQNSVSISNNISAVLSLMEENTKKLFLTISHFVPNLKVTGASFLNNNLFQCNNPSEIILKNFFGFQVTDLENISFKFAVRKDDKYFLNLTINEYTERKVQEIQIPPNLTPEQLKQIIMHNSTISAEGVEVKVDFNNMLYTERKPKDFSERDLIIMIKDFKEIVQTGIRDFLATNKI